jgi:hypothetical protein
MGGFVIGGEANYVYAESVLFMSLLVCVERVSPTTNVVERGQASAGVLQRSGPKNRKAGVPNPGFPKRRRREYHFIVYYP